MYQGEEPPHHHHLPKMVDDDDDDYDNHHDHHDNNEYDPQTPYPTAVSHQQPPATPQQPLQPPKPLLSPTSRPPSKKRSTPTATPPPPPPQVIVPPPQQPLQPPQPMFLPSSPPQKPRAPPQYHHHDNDDNNSSRRQLCAVITTILLLLGLTALILWLLYRPSKPQFTAISVAVYFLNTTAPPPFVTTSLQLTVLTRNPSKRTSLYYDRLTLAIHYRNHPITPPAPLPPLHHRKRSTVMMSPVVGGGVAVAVPSEVVEGLAADEAYGVVGLSWVLRGRVKYRAGWYKSGHNRVYVRCDVIVGFKNGDGSNPNGQVPLLGNPPCLVDV